jgi:Transcriptional Coactivator p15 (PC4)
MSKKSVPLSEPVVVAEWWRDRSGRSIRVRLSSYEGYNLIDIRTFYSDADGKLKPGKGFCASFKHLPRLAAELDKALAKARELGLVESEAQK